MKFHCLAGFIAATLPFSACSAQNPDAEMRALAADFTLRYNALELPAFGLSWRDNMAAIADREALESQKIFFEDMRARLSEMEPDRLSTCEARAADILTYQTDINLRRIALEQDFIAGGRTIPDEARTLADMPNGAAWYDFYLDRWLTVPMSPADVTDFGETQMREVEAARAANIEPASGMVTRSFVSDVALMLYDDQEIRERYALTGARVEQNLPTLFKSYDIEAVKIGANTDPAMARVPGLYNPANGTFYYVFDELSYNAKHVDYLYLHEAVPGHHFQYNVSRKYSACDLELPDAYYSAWSEGWAAYVETLGEDLGVYQTRQDRLGAIDWDQIRSIRVVMDVGLNYHGWDDVTALNYWFDNMPDHLHDLAPREIQRMRDWPAQVITYKVGADAFMTAAAHARERQGEDFDIREFHHRILTMGPVPLDVMLDEFAAP